MKKERYFTPESIESKSREMLHDIKDLRRRHLSKISSKHSALLVLDMQNYFLDESSHAFIPSARATVSGISNLIETYSKLDLPIIFTRHQNTEADAQMMSKWWKDIIKPNSTNSEIIPEISTTEGTIIYKTQYDAFHETKLAELLNDKGISQIVICGVMTHLCCETTARTAFVRGFEVFLAINGTATYSEPLHRATLWNAAHGFAIPMLIGEMIENLSNADEK